MKRSILRTALALTLIATMVLTAAATGAAPQVEDLSISGGSHTVTKTEVSGSLVFTAPSNSQVTDYTATVSLTDGAVFTPTTHTEGELYVASATDSEVTLKFDIRDGSWHMDNYSEFDLVLTKSNDNTWTGGFENASYVKLYMLAGYLAEHDLHLSAGALGAGSSAQKILVNEDELNVMLVLCAPNVAVNTVTYVTNSTTLVWKLPQGMTIPTPTFEDGEVEWYTDAAHTVAFAGGTLTENTTLYGLTAGSTTPEENDFYEDLINHRTATIYSEDDFAIFAQYANQAVAGQLVRLGDTIDCGGASYPSLTFAGNFDGCGFALSNATFEARDNATSSGEECSGMFATLGAGQKVVNLKLDNITVEHAGDYAGALAGVADGASNNRALIQNVQVSNSSVSGRSAGGVVGFIRNADVKYCSSRSTTISGLANGGGIVGLNNAHVEFCFSTTSPTALPSLLGGSAGGVIGKNVRGGNNNYCWAYMTVVGAAKDYPGEDLNSLVANASMPYLVFVGNGFSQACWIAGSGMPADFNSGIVTYRF